MEGVSLFCDVALAARIERAEVDLVRSGNEAARRRGATGIAIPVAGGIASNAEDGSPLNKLAGLGFDGVPTKAELDEIERAFGDLPVQAEISTLADPAVAAAFTGRGYQLVSFENVLGLSLDGGCERIAPPGITVRRTDEDFEAWLDVLVDGFAHPDDQGVPSHEEFPCEILANAVKDLSGPGSSRYVALREGELVGAASCRMTEGVAQLNGAATAPAHRRRGVQTALLSARLADLAEAGADIAVIITQPGSKSQQNAQRRGFDLLYTRAILVKQP
ncbi:GNAT family N-acetyltransferase [Actinocrispum sp. NPDC049592]|uniref:GNAT family N-acetyltransferase n=1 Tax=Actinocrispum sp. NPDC049592 TaxID=3154835 RepID=UPI00342FE1E2